MGAVSEATHPGSWRLRIKHHTATGLRQRRSRPPTTRRASRRRPLNGQLVITSRIDVKPARPARLATSTTGARSSTSFDVQTSHTELSVTVDVARRHRAARRRARRHRRGPPWPRRRVTDRWCEYLGPSGAGDDRARPDRRRSPRCGPRPTRRPAVQVALEIVTARLAYKRARPTCRRTDAEAWALREGVCQDYSHLAIALAARLRHPRPLRVGVPAPRTRATSARPSVGESHAWIEAWLGGWKAYDPTNRRPVGERHVLVGLGRDYTDVPAAQGHLQRRPGIAPGRHRGADPPDEVGLARGASQVAPDGCAGRLRAEMEQLLTILKLCLLALLYLFFLRVLRAVWVEVNGPKQPAQAPAVPAGRVPVGPAAVAAAAPPRADARAAAPARRKATPAHRGRAGRPAGPRLPGGRRAHRRAGGRLPGHPRRHLRLPAPRPRVPPRRPALRRGPRLDQRHLPQPHEGHGPVGDAAAATGCRSATPCWSSR